MPYDFKTNQFCISCASRSEEILFKKQHGYVIFITSFIEQKGVFLERPLEEQFFLALKAFEMQEGVHTTTYEHAKIISKVFGVMNAKKYIKTFEKFKKDITLQNQNSRNAELNAVLTRAFNFLKENGEIIDLYSGFLTHWDFVPHNIRAVNHDIYLLDHSSFYFGNKYESWARFINFMTLYNRSLEKILIEYVQKNRTKEEFLSLKLMRIFRLADLIRHYTETIKKSSGNLIVLNQKRVEFWTNALEAVLNDKFLSQDIIEEYKSTRDRLRSDEEKRRQKELY